MKINFEHCITAPVSFKKDKNAISVYLIAFGITLISFFIFIPMQIISQVSFFLIPEEVTNYNFILILLSNIAYGLLLPFLLNIPVLIFPAGYIVETIKRELNSEEYLMPLWKDKWKLFFINGIKTLSLLAVYFIVVVIFIYICINALNSITSITNFLAPQMTSSINILCSIIITLSSILFITVILISSPFIIIHSVKHNSFRKGLNIIDICKKIYHNWKDYLVGLSLVIFLVITLIVKVLGLICSLVGILLIPLVSEFIIPIMIMNMFTQIYKTTENIELKE